MQYVAVVLAAVVGTLATLAVFGLVLSWEQRSAQLDFQSKATGYIAVVNDDLSSASTLLSSLGAFIDAGDAANAPRRFEQFSRTLRGQFVGVRDIGWAPRVTRAQRPAFERAQRAAGIAGFRIRELDARGRFVPALDRPAYYPAFSRSVAPDRTTNREITGFDLGSEPNRAAAIAATLRTGRPSMTRPVQLMASTGPIAGIVGFMSVRDPRIGDVPQGSPGVVVAIFATASMVASINARTSLDDGLELYLFDPGGKPGQRLISWSTSDTGEPHVLSEAAVLAAPHWQGSVTMLDRHWLAVVRPTAALRAQTRHVDSALTLATGAIMTAMIVAYLVISLRGTNQIATVARRDALTGLPNRLYFQERLADAVAGYRHDAPFAILSLDLDGFKTVNDTLGHVTGDALLCLVAARIAGCLREVDSIARLGGDEFALILTDKTSEDKIASVAARLIGEVGKPYAIDEQTIVVGASIGIAVATAGTSAERLLKEADLALYEAKDAGRATYRFFEARLRLQMEAKRTLEGDMRRALANGEFELYYQPIVSLAQGRVTSFEALLRWNHPQHGLLAADRFITVAEECGLIVPLGAWALRTACEQAVRWPVPVKVAVNISPRQFRDEDLASSVLRCLTLSGLPPQRLEIEITEAAVLQEADATLAVFRDLRTMGVTVAFDDFGTGFSSLSSLLRFRFDKLKIDRSFLAPIETSENARAIVRAIVGLGSQLAMATTGEGVETREQLADLQRLGCSEAQGYFFSRPRPNRDVPRLLRELNGYSGKVIGSIGA